MVTFYSFVESAEGKSRQILTKVVWKILGGAIRFGFVHGSIWSFSLVVTSLFLGLFRGLWSFASHCLWVHQYTHLLVLLYSNKGLTVESFSRGHSTLHIVNPGNRQRLEGNFNGNLKQRFRWPTEVGPRIYDYSDRLTLRTKCLLQIVGKLGSKCKSVAIYKLFQKTLMN